jgi:hypothetical protein
VIVALREQLFLAKEITEAGMGDRCDHRRNLSQAHFSLELRVRRTSTDKKSTQGRNEVEQSQQQPGRAGWVLP